MIKTFKNEQFELSYIDTKYKLELNNINNYFIIELYRLSLYHRLSDKIKNILLKSNNKNLDNVIDENEYDENENDIKRIKLKIYTNILSIFIFNNKKNLIKDPLFSNNSIFDDNNINEVILDMKLEEDVIINVKKIFPILNKYYIKYYFLIQKMKNEDLTNFTFNVKYEIQEKDSMVILSCSINIEKIGKRRIFLSNYKVPLFLFKTLINRYNKVVLNIDNAEINDDKCITCIYMLYNRYRFLNSGTNQASVLGKIKKIFKNNLQIDMELFSSALNTNLNYFCSVFYDIEWVFGSLNNYFDTNIISGYYEINPPFNKKICDESLIKTFNELKVSEKNKKPLLFLFILPTYYFDIIKDDVIYEQLNKYKKNNILVNEKNFPYYFYSNDYKKMFTNSIVNTRIIIYSNNYISKDVSNNIYNIKKIISSNKLIKK